MIKLDNTYSDYVDVGDSKYPAGKAVNASGSENTDGTPFLAEWMNDINGTRQALIKEAFGGVSGISGVPDNADSSDVLKAIKKITQGYTDSEILKEVQARNKGDVDTLNSSKNYVENKFIEHYKKCYVQFPGFPSPLEDVAMHFEGYSWYELNYNGAFFRAKGENAKPFSSKKFTREDIINGTAIFKEEEQGDAIRDIAGQSASYMAFRDKYPGTESKGAFYRDWTYAMGVGGAGTTDSIHVGGFGFLASRAVPVANENRPRNLTYTIWVLLKDE